jgi:hypothetical protein
VRRLREFVSLREYFESLLREMDLRYQQRYDASNLALNAALLAAEKAVATAMIAAEKAVQKAEVAADKRFDLLNELRMGVATREQFESLETIVNTLKDDISAIRGKSSGTSASWAMMLGAGGFILTVIGVATAVLVAAHR